MAKEMWENFKSGFVKENPVFALYLGICSVLAITTTLNNALGMGITVTIVLILANTIVSLLRKITPNEIRIPVYIVIISTLVKSSELLIKAYAPTLDTALGVFIPLIVVNCIILGRAEAYASKHSVIESAVDGLGKGLGYTFGLIIMSVIRQVLGTGVLNLTNPFTGNMIFEIQIIPADYVISVFTQAVGAFLTFALIAAAVSALNARKQTKGAK
ncbi:MAG: electron transport complex subunit RsxE [Erysipelotrichaceae bacterium]|nr:electron transport complex subunit RsxE [Erysipelotrichaceae bacterium]MDD3924322.1 electron transport complex subunit RsxE [Erysipelotrichaceae bacterium]MDD4642242.1 electron transport complex subunit RsxE [Erysipelotrichaceae bacterium]